MITQNGILILSLKNDGDINLSPSFKVREFACKDGSDAIRVAVELVGILQHLRAHFGLPVTITSGYRTSMYNAKVGGSPNSQHVQGRAADIQIRGIEPQKIYDYMHHVIDWHGGLGLYATFVHIDVHTKRRWSQ